MTVTAKKGRKFDRATDRRKAREYYEQALARDAGHVASLRSLAVLDFEAALTYPSNLNVGRSNKPEEAAAQYWRGQALAALARADEAQAAWQAGAAGADMAGVQNEYRQKCHASLTKKR